MKLSTDLSSLIIPGSEAKNPTDPSKMMPVTDEANPKCDQACTNGDRDQRRECNIRCATMQATICSDKFVGCHKACDNDMPSKPKDPECEALCGNVIHKLCYPFAYEAPAGAVTPTLRHAPPKPSAVKRKAWTGSFMFCNLYPADYHFDVLVVPEGVNASTYAGPSVADLSYKKCTRLQMTSFESIALRARGVIAGISRPIVKIPSMMLFGQWAFGNHQVEFNRYFAKGDGAFICNGFPMWESTQKGKKVEVLRGGYKGHTLANLRYKECMPSGVTSGEVLAAKIDGHEAGEYSVHEAPSAVVIGKAGQTTSLSFEAWQGHEQ